RLPRAAATRHGGVHRRARGARRGRRLEGYPDDHHPGGLAPAPAAASSHRRVLSESRRRRAFPGDVRRHAARLGDARALARPSAPHYPLASLYEGGRPKTLREVPQASLREVLPIPDIVAPDEGDFVIVKPTLRRFSR